MNPERPLKILLAEDERSVAFSVAFALRSDGHQIEVVPDGEQALSKLTAEPNAFELLITDNNMPRMSGVELVTQLRHTAFAGRILVLSAHLSPDNRAAYSVLGVDEMIPKPFDVHELRSVIKRIAPPLEPISDQNDADSEESIAPAPLDPFQLSPTQLCGLLKLGLSESDEATDLADSF